MWNIFKHFGRYSKTVALHVRSRRTRELRAESCTRLLRQTCTTWIKRASESRGGCSETHQLIACSWMPNTYSALSKTAFTFFDLDELCVFIDSTSWYFLKARANGGLLRWLSDLPVPRPARSHLTGTACIIIQSRCMRAPSPKFLRLTSPGERRSDDYIRPTFTPPRHAGFQLITHTNMHTQSHYRWIHIAARLTAWGGRHSCMHIAEFHNFNYVFSSIGSRRISGDFKAKRKKSSQLYKLQVTSRWLERNLSQGFCAGLDENITCVMGCENSSCKKH